MKLNEYQKGALETAIYPQEYKIIYPTLGLTGEAGECAEKVKKFLRGDDGGKMTEERRKLIALEIGDVLWYCATLASDIGYTLENIAEMNLEKLRSRQLRNRISGDGDER